MNIKSPAEDQAVRCDSQRWRELGDTSSLPYLALQDDSAPPASAPGFDAYENPRPAPPPPRLPPTPKPYRAKLSERDELRVHVLVGEASRVLMLQWGLDPRLIPDSIHEDKQTGRIIPLFLKRPGTPGR